MANYQFIPSEQKQLLVVMLCKGLSPKEISGATGVSVRTIQRVRRLWLDTGKVVKPALEMGRPRVLSSLEVNVRGSSLPMFCNLQFCSTSKALLNRSQIYIAKSCGKLFLLLTILM